jgi:hypothetical protein
MATPNRRYAMNLNNLEQITNPKDARFTHEQQVMVECNISKGWVAYIEEYADYTYAVLVKEGVRNGVKRLNKTGHNVQI